LDSRKPSSLDYSSYLHILALQRFRDSILKDDLRRAEAAAENVAASPEPFWKWVGSMDLATIHLYRGQSRRALRVLEEAALVYGRRGAFTALGHVTASHVLIERGENAAALERAREARRSDPASPEAAWFAAVASARLGTFESAEALSRELSEAQPWRREHVRGEILLAQRDPHSAALAFKSAATLLASQDVASTKGLSGYVPVWFSLGTAQLASHEDDARTSFLRVADARELRIDWPILYVRSLHALAMIHERRGETDAANEYRTRWNALWTKADLRVSVEPI